MTYVRPRSVLQLNSVDDCDLHKPLSDEQMQQLMEESDDEVNFSDEENFRPPEGYDESEGSEDIEEDLEPTNEENASNDGWKQYLPTDPELPHFPFIISKPGIMLLFQNRPKNNLVFCRYSVALTKQAGKRNWVFQIVFY